jgi:hypothetical protein
MMRYIVKKNEQGWQVWDTTTGTCVDISGVKMDDLSEKCASEFADHLNEDKPMNGSDDSTRH